MSVSISDPDERNNLLERVELVACVLGLPDREVETAMNADNGLAEFAWKHNQSLDWLVFGDVTGMIRRAKAEGGAS
jgi:hypothetical protein